MMNSGFDRRDFLKVLGWGGTAVALSGCGNGMVEDGKETVVSYVETQRLHDSQHQRVFQFDLRAMRCRLQHHWARTRRARAEAGRQSRIPRSIAARPAVWVRRACSITTIRIACASRCCARATQGEAITWEKAYALIAEKLKGVSGEEIAFLTGGVSGHLKVLMGNYLDSFGCKNHFVYEAIAPAVVRAANKKSYGVEMPRFNISKAKVVLSFGADFLGAWVSPVHFSQQYAQFRKGVDGQRGVLIQVESEDDH